MDKNVLRSFCVVYYIIPAVMYPVMLYQYPVCCKIEPDICRFIVLGDTMSYYECYNIVPHAAISYRNGCYVVVGDAVSYRMLLYIVHGDAISHCLCYTEHCIVCMCCFTVLGAATFDYIVLLML